MTKHLLPTVDPARTEFDFCRTQCDCRECTRNCHHIPGYLIPADLERIHCHLAPGQNLFDWAKDHLLASPGAVVMSGNQKWRIHTLVPARRPDGACTFLTETCNCSIHEVSPFGCAFFDSHQARTEADRRSKLGLHAVLDAWESCELYAQVWMYLAYAGLVAPAPEQARQQLRHAADDGPQ